MAEAITHVPRLLQIHHVRIRPWVCHSSLILSPQGTPGPALGKFNFKLGKSYRVRLIKPSSSASPIFISLDKHTMTVIAIDVVPIVRNRHCRNLVYAGHTMVFDGSNRLCVSYLRSRMIRR